ncbi:TPA: hypothetical protein ACGIJM_003578 [Acinetobacter baumannii]|jgi:hypothetical protein|uniref:hypothetical protein n=1 Tax=Acinetobacter TaxID=469 RepID=UPI0015BD061C|nr:hypothetical protein [Acinetobacter sp. SwsAc2]MCT9496942.1 hypothetical protein [Acinetobacter baumannii]NWK60974.1 hypothetical protein [Acinetobacter sp. SwsAc2]HCT2640342.1 hypothetical protein [Acinetobacter baumannii]
MEFLIFILLIAVLIIFLKIKKKKPKVKDISKVIQYTSKFTNPQNPTISFDDVFYSDLEEYINRNTRVHILERKQDSVVFTVQIENVNYKVFATKFIYNQLVIGVSIIN